MTLRIVTGALVVLLSGSQGQTDDPFIAHLNSSLKQYAVDYRVEKAHLLTDRFVYRPGDDLWFKGFVVSSGEEPNKPKSEDFFIKLLNSKGEEMISRRYPVTGNQTAGRLLIPRTFIPGRYWLVAYTGWMKNQCSCEAFRKEILISKYFDKRFQVEPFYDKDNYYSGDTLKAMIRILDQTGKPIPEIDYEYTLGSFDRREIKGSGKTDTKGFSDISCVIPESEQILMMTVDIRSRKLFGDYTLIIPAVTAKPEIAFFPEGGKLVKGLKNTMAFSAYSAFGQPTPVTGEISDREGNILQSVMTNEKGIGLFDYTPMDDTCYLKITKPSGILQQFPLPMAEDRGWIIHCEEQESDSVCFRITASDDSPPSVSYWVASMDHRIVWSDVIHFNQTARVTIPVQNLPEGILQVSVFNQEHELDAERLIRILHPAEKFTIKTDHQTYHNRQRVHLSLEYAGKENTLDLAISVSLLHLSTHPLMTSLYDAIHSIPRDSTENKRLKLALVNDADLLTTDYRTICWRDVLKDATSDQAYKLQNGLSGKVYDKKENLSQHAKVRVTHVPNYRSYETQTDETGTFKVAFGADIIDFNFLNVDAYDALGKVNLSASIDQDYFENLRSTVTSEGESSNFQKAIDVFTYGEPDLVYALRYGPGKFRKSVPDARRKYDPNQYAGYSSVLDIIQDMKPYKLVDNTIVFTGEDDVIPRLITQTGTIVVINGALKGSKIDILQNLLPSDITNINISTSLLDVHKYTPISFQGVIEITTIQGIYKNRQPTIQLGMDILNTNRTFYSPDYSIESPTSGDNRKTLYWNPGFQLRSGEMRLLSFFTSDIKGTYYGIVEGVDKYGNPVKASFSFVVE